MDKYNHLTLDFTHPPKQTESYSFHLGDDFFDEVEATELLGCLLYTSPSPRDS